MKINAFSLCLLLVSLTLAIAKLSCLDRNGKDVPWFTLLKFPGSVTKTGERYAYFDDNSGGAYEIVNGTLADGKDEPLAKTIESINAISKSHINLYVYNDEYPVADPNLTTTYNAHAKGIIAYDNDTRSGVYIMHSLPKFPQVTNSTGHIDYNFPDTTDIYGQNMYCISLDKEILQQILTYLPLEKPNAYYASGLFENFHTDSKANYTVTQFTLLNGDNQWLFTKNPKYPGYLYEDVISDYFQVALAVESWGRPYQANACPPSVPFAVYNILKIALDDVNTWDHTSDHSKWAVTVNDDKTKLACLCDMNRMTSQSSRGGSCLCSDNKNLYKALTGVFSQGDPCSATEKISLDKM